jgi:hypothetical protein
MMAEEHRIDPPAPDDGDAPAPTGLTGGDARLAPGYVHVDAHPDHGEPVIYTPGELLPPWVQDALKAGGTLAVEGPGHFRLVMPRGRAPSGRHAPRRQTAGGQ